MDSEGCLARLAELSISHEIRQHSTPVMTVEAQAADLEGTDGVITKNLFLKDKRGRLYIVTAQADTKVDLKSLSARLGVGKGAVRLAPDDLVGSVLGVPLGSVTPLAVAQPAAAATVCLLLDAKLRLQPRVWVHPLTNRSSVGLTPAELEAFLRSLGREPAWVDLEADVKVDKDNPPDLKQFAEAFEPAAKGGEDGGSGTPDAPAAAAAQAAAAPAAAAGGGKQKGGGKAAAAAKPAAARPAVPRADVQATAEAVLAAVLAAAGSSAEAVGPDAMRRLRADVEAELSALRNAAYAGGFAAARGGIMSLISREFA